MVRVRRDGGLNWSDLSSGLAPGRWVTRVVASSFDEGTVYVSQSGYRDDEFSPYVFRATRSRREKSPARQNSAAPTIRSIS